MHFYTFFQVYCVYGLWLLTVYWCMLIMVLLPSECIDIVVT